MLDTLASESRGVVTAVVRLPGAAAHPVPPGGFPPSFFEVLPVSWIALQDELSVQARHDLTRLGGWMLAALVVLCAMAQRSVRLVVLNMVALAVALFVLVALLAVTGTAMSPLSLLAIPLLFGLVIDYSLHILMALEHSNGDLRHTYSHLAAPVVLTGLSSAIGFGAPMLTGQPALQSFGLVMDFGILAAVTTCLFVLPPLYHESRPPARTGHSLATVPSSPQASESRPAIRGADDA
jgi:predicted exporter